MENSEGTKTLERLSELRALQLLPDLRVFVARTPIQVRELMPDVEDLLRRTDPRDDLTGTTAYFLTVIQQKRARPLAVAVYDGASLAGIVYAFRRCLFGISMGVVEGGDSCGDGFVFAAEDLVDQVLDIALECILREGYTWLTRLSWYSGSSDLVNSALARVCSSPITVRAVNEDVFSYLSLDDTYEHFLERLGSQTRRNMRYYRRRAEKLQWMFVSNIDSEVAGAALKAHSLQGIGRKDDAKLTRLLRRIEDVPGSFYSGLQTSDGEWTSIVGGWVRGKHLFILIQLNHPGYTNASVSMVLRSYVIENAIHSGIRHLTFIGGCEGALKKYCRRGVTHLLVQRKGFLAGICVHAAQRLFPCSLTSKLLCNIP